MACRHGALVDYTRTVGRVFDPTVTIGFALKTVLFGLAVAVIPTAAILEIQRCGRAGVDRAAGRGAPAVRAAGDRGGFAGRQIHLRNAHDRTPTPQPAEPVAHVEVKAVILLVLMTALIAAFLLYVMYARGVFEPTQRLVLVSEDSEGVIPGMDMTFSGFPIGRVQRVELAPDGKARILVDVPRRMPNGCACRACSRWSEHGRRDPHQGLFSGILTDPPLAEGATRTVLRGDTAAEIPALVASARALLENLDA
jgi:hypothetical protein